MLVLKNTYLPTFHSTSNWLELAVDDGHYFLLPGLCTSGKRTKQKSPNDVHIFNRAWSNQYPLCTFKAAYIHKTLLYRHNGDIYLEIYFVICKNLLTFCSTVLAPLEGCSPQATPLQSVSELHSSVDMWVSCITLRKIWLTEKMKCDVYFSYGCMPIKAIRNLLR